MTSCEEFEIAALRLARGSLAADEAARLGVHLAGCAACRGFAASAQATQAALRDRVVGASAGRDWDGAALRRRVTGIWRRVAACVAVLVGTFALNWWENGLRSALGLGALCTVVLAAGLWLAHWPRIRRARRAEAAGEDLLACYRADLDGELARLRTSRGAAAAIAVLDVVVIATRARSVLLHGVAERVHLVQLVCAVSLLAFMAYRFLVALPRLERERRELGQ